MSKAWIVRSRNGVEGYCVVRFGETAGKAKYAGLSELREYGEADELTELSAKRFPAMDGREDNPPSLQELVDEHGWSTQCVECERRITGEGASRHFYEEDDGPEYEDVVWSGDLACCKSCSGVATTPTDKEPPDA